MNKEEMVGALSQRARLTRKDAETALDAVFEIITETLSSGGKVKIVGFGVFEVKNRAPKVGRNPGDNIPVPIPARKIPIFKPGKLLKEAVDFPK